MDHVAAATRKIEEVRKLAKTLYNVDVDVTLKFNIRSPRLIGQAQSRTGGKFIIRLNPTLLAAHPDVVINDTIPHEMAHIVCFALPRLGGNGHNHVWKRICKELGGQPERLNSNAELVETVMKMVRQVKQHVYMVNGVEIRLSNLVHRRVQAGQRRWILFNGQLQVFGKEHYVTGAASSPQ